MDETEFEDVQETLIGLVDDGLLFGRCPGCQIPLTSNEIKTCTCITCGKIDPADVTYFPNESVVPS